ncbi:MAG TPA: hypothetical protein DHV51_01360 [Opitutae bacterium]|nr:hypothetical protein [Opitutae bacterium]
MEKVSPRFKPYFDILVALEKKVQGEIEEHAHDTLKHTDASGETAGNDMLNKDADSYDLDFALGIVTSEKLLLDEIEQAIDRIFDGSYGICEVTGKPIPKERLLAVPFTRCSLEGQKEQERKNAALRKKPVDEGVFTRDDDDDDIPLTYTEEESDL